MEERIFQAPNGFGQVRVVIYRYDDGSTDQQIFYENRRDNASSFSGSNTQNSNMPPRPNPISTIRLIIRTLQIGLFLYFGFLFLGILLSLFVPREEVIQQQQQHRYKS